MDIQGQAVTVNARSVTVLTLLSAGYLLLSYYLIGFKTDEVVLVAMVNGLFYISPITRKFILGFAIFAVYWIIFDYMKAFPNYRFNAVHIADLYNFDKDLFGFTFNGKRVSTNEYWLANSKPWIDIMGGIFYLCWIPVPMAFAIYLFFTRKKEFLYFALTFFTVNMLGFVVYYTFPAAPPWYVQLHGFEFIANTPGNVAGLARFDALVGSPVFKGIYAKGSNVFAAMPSLHSAYPIIVVYYGLKNKLGWFNIILATVMVGIWFTAVYASHHYIVDVLMGIVCATVGILFFNALAHTKTIGGILNNYVKIVS
ncbi:phosphatase PAP2 family protein [Mucilaginibacter myungsuensis]|uniref:Inositol phosphorylceramide synthase n=1 Tax=Mucilaginibacter myungsuensis TaxID=649104 RepID=A0A929PX05_9SPHI|nr:phosphatase PAP2 family protein [Mucilaginibacter myungsuensis]MBE9661895.1 inositol phosphorylceramide synthase [Mucilaginibacter myungsuensis]MDN3599671.1 phosphatase PAP2 family protein [Mucilaginibacter myungsuensis]